MAALAQCARAVRAVRVNGGEQPGGARAPYGPDDHSSFFVFTTLRPR